MVFPKNPSGSRYRLYHNRQIIDRKTDLLLLSPEDGAEREHYDEEKEFHAFWWLDTVPLITYNVSHSRLDRFILFSF
jgi:hypothetical protein